MSILKNKDNRPLLAATGTRCSLGTYRHAAHLWLTFCPAWLLCCLADWWTYHVQTQKWQFSKHDSQSCLLLWDWLSARSLCLCDRHCMLAAGSQLYQGCDYQRAMIQRTENPVYIWLAMNCGDRPMAIHQQYGQWFQALTCCMDNHASCTITGLSHACIPLLLKRQNAFWPYGHKHFFGAT